MRLVANCDVLVQHDLMMSKIIVLVFSLVGLFSVGVSQVVKKQQCDNNVPIQPDFDIKSFAGTWYEIESYNIAGWAGQCVTHELSYVDSTRLNLTLAAVHHQFKRELNGVISRTSATDNSGKLTIAVTDDSGKFTSDYWVLATDYGSYALVYSCEPVNDEYVRVYSWKLGRKPIIPEEVKSKIDDVIEKVQVLDKKYFTPRKHTAEACFHYPDMDDGHIILNGQCPSDDEVPVITNFNPVAFSGIWYEVSRYPSELQNGECSTTQYTLGVGNNFNVTHTSVILEEKLETVTQASFAVNGRGVIDIDVNGVPFNKVYILATDNTMRDYALAYSCQDLDDNRKQLYSWKLSRSRAGLSEAANNAINQLISTNIDLHEPYYQTTGQDHASCFYYPEFEELPPSIELPGPCNDSISGIADFNMLDFTGTWYELARYPQPAQTGQCNRAVYTSQDTGFSFVHSQVTDEVLGEISGQAVVGDDGSIVVTLNVGEETRTAKYYVLATDYDSYAFLYSCVTIDNGERRRVGSWKLSKTTELSPQATSQIEEVISRTQGLRKQYYQETSQTDAACFYYPEFDEPPPYIELPGLCNLSVSAVPDFRIEDLVGTWFEVSRYPQPAQAGQCNLIQINTGSTPGSITIQATEIIDGSLYEIRGDGRVSSSDGSGILTVLYDSDSVLQHYVLATDYYGFALIYTCINLPHDYKRRVFSWKLSRNIELSVSANATVNEIIDATQGLTNEYYLGTSHSHQACFYHPPQTGDKVIIPGQCDDNIPAMQSFNVARFANNTWYHIERYDAVGDSSCVGTRLTYDDRTGAIEVLNFEVVDEVLVTREGSGRLNSSDGSGLFSLVMDDSEDGEDTKTKIYILTTDYDEYALAYTCKNINSNERQVGAWQLSRGRNLTEEHKAAIAEVINERPELHEPYFKSISQHEECQEPSSSFFFKSSFILILVCNVLNLLR